MKTRHETHAGMKMHSVYMKTRHETHAGMKMHSVYIRADMKLMPA